MRRLILLFTMGSLSWAGLAARAADPASITPFVGSWTAGEELSADHELPLEALSLKVERDADGFRVYWHDLSAGDAAGTDHGSIDVRFQPTERAGVYEFAPSPSSLLTRMFASPATGNPLKGETLLWARIDGSTLAVYSMRIDAKGSFNLDHYSWTRTGDSLQLVYRQKTEDAGLGTRLEGELVAGGG